MNDREANGHALRIAALWATKIPLKEWIHALLPFDSAKTAIAIARLRDKQDFPPSVAVMLSEITSVLETSRPPRNVDPLVDDEGNSTDTEYRRHITLAPELCETGLDRIAELRERMAEVAARSTSTMWRRKTATTPAPSPQAHRIREAIAERQADGAPLAETLAELDELERLAEQERLHAAEHLQEVSGI